MDTMAEPTSPRPVTAESEPLGLRERKKAATRQAIYQAALRLTLEHGFEHVTVEAIAEAADISRRTFSNYFAGKEDALLYGEERRTRALLEAVRRRPAEESAWTALRRATRTAWETVDTKLDRDLVLRIRLAKQHPSLRARQLANHAALERDLVAAIAGRTCEGGQRPLVLVATFLTGLRLAGNVWLDEEPGRELVDVTEELLDEIAAPFTRSS